MILRQLNPAFDIARFGLRLRDAKRRALLLDFDGTLAAFVADRLAARPYPGVREELGAIVAAGTTRIAVVSGRPLGELESLLDLPVELWGSHGMEHRMPGGLVEACAPAEETARLIEAVSAWAAERGWGRLLEPKPFGLALHARPDSALYEKAWPALLARWSAPARKAGLEVCLFDSGVELRPGGRHKGHVVDRVLAQMEPEGLVAYLGDDETDEDAFAALSGRGLGVLVRAKARPTKADAWVSPPDDLIAFLSGWRRVAEGGPLDGLGAWA